MWILFFFTLALLYLISLRFQPFRGDYLLKPIPILLLALIAFTQLPTPFNTIIGIALLLSAGGDIALAIDHDRYFVIGLGLFLLAHIAYVIGFAQQLAWQTIALIPIIFIAIFAGTLTQRLYPHLGKLHLPVLCYIIVIGLMGVTASLFSPFNWLLVIGTLIFMVSDASIAVDKFLQPLPARDYLVMTTYYLAQFLILYALL